MQSASGEVPDGRRSWVIAGVGSNAIIYMFGTPLSYGVFREPFSEAFAVSSVALSAVFSLMLFTFFIRSGLVRVFAARLPARWILLTCAGATALLAPSLYFVESYLSLAVVFAVLGLALGTVFVLVTSVVPRWFEARHGAATGLIFMGNGLGLFVLSPLWQVALEAAGRKGLREFGNGSRDSTRIASEALTEVEADYALVFEQQALLSTSPGTPLATP